MRTKYMIASLMFDAFNCGSPFVALFL